MPKILCRQEKHELNAGPDSSCIYLQFTTLLSNPRFVARLMKSRLFFLMQGVNTKEVTETLICFYLNIVRSLYKTSFSKIVQALFTKV